MATKAVKATVTPVNRHSTSGALPQLFDPRLLQKASSITEEDNVLTIFIKSRKIVYKKRIADWQVALDVSIGDVADGAEGMVDIIRNGKIDDGVTAFWQAAYSHMIDECEANRSAKMNTNLKALDEILDDHPDY